MVRQVFQQQHGSQLSMCGTPAAAQAMRHGPHGCAPPPALTPVPLRINCFSGPPSVTGSDRSPPAAGPRLSDVADVLRRGAELAEPLPAEVRPTFQSLLIAHGTGPRSGSRGVLKVQQL